MYLEKFSIGTLNLFNFVKPPFAFYEQESIYTEKQWQEKTRWTELILSEANADIVAFQEVFSIDELKVLAHGLGYRYFEVVDQPVISDGFVGSSPVVAIASKFKIESVEPVNVDQRFAIDVGLGESFALSRLPLKATVNIEGFAKTTIYVVHLKSGRPTFSSEHLSNNDDVQDESEQSLVSKILAGKLKSNMQRYYEAALVYRDFCRERSTHGRPAMILGDFNDQLHSPLLSDMSPSAVLGRELPFHLQDKDKVNPTIAKFGLWNANQLCLNRLEKALPTHYMGSKGIVLDHIQLSSEFDADQQQSLAEVVDYKTFDRHLVRPCNAKDRQCSDHAMVLADISIRF